MKRFIPGYNKTWIINLTNSRNKDFVRLDRYLVGEGFVPSRHRAEMLIKEHGVKVNGKSVHKTGYRIFPEDEVELIEEDFKWVSRGALKLKRALDHWNIMVEGLRCVDAGASTGGFSQLLVERGALEVFAIDTGKDQLHKSLLRHPQIHNHPSTNISDFELQEEADLLVADLSFVSLRRFFPDFKRLVRGKIITLFKPQFEVGKEFVGKNGIVKDSKRVKVVLEETKAAAKKEGIKFVDMIESPIEGGDGNKEYLIYWRH